MQVWDTAGHERYYSITKQYYAGAMGAIICYDGTNSESLKNAKSWLTQYRSASADPKPVILTANKADLHWRVSRSDGQALADKHDALFLETSAVSGKNVDETFDYISRAVLGGAGQEARCCYLAQEHALRIVATSDFS